MLTNVTSTTIKFVYAKVEMVAFMLHFNSEAKFTVATYGSCYVK